MTNYSDTVLLTVVNRR